MFATPKLFAPEIAKTKKFVRDHRTPIACAATAVVTAYITTNTLLVVMKDAYSVLGAEHVITEVQRDILLDFVNNKGLKDEVTEYIAAIGTN